MVENMLLSAKHTVVTVFYTLLSSLSSVSAVIDLHLNTHKTHIEWYVCYLQPCAVFVLLESSTAGQSVPIQQHNENLMSLISREAPSPACIQLPTMAGLI